MPSNAPIDENDTRGLIAASSADGVTPVKLYADPTTHRLLTQNTALTELTATGTVNGVNTAFVFASQPTYIVSDGVWYKTTDNNGATQWSWDSGTTTATMIVPPTYSIYGF